MSHCNEMICPQVTLSGYAEWPKVADAVINASMSSRKRSTAAVPSPSEASQDGHHPYPPLAVDKPHKTGVVS